MPRATWAGSLSLEGFSCRVSLYAAASTAERVIFHTLNRKTGHRVHAQSVDSETGDVVEPGDVVKGWDAGDGRYVLLEADEIAAALPEHGKTLAIEAFVPCAEIDDLYFDRPYYLAPGDAAAAEGFVAFRDGLRSKKMVALARGFLFRRMRTLLVRAHAQGLVASTLKFDYEVRPASAAFADVPATRAAGEMLDLAKHIIKTKMGAFNPAHFDDRYEAAIVELIRAKTENRPIPKPKRAAGPKVVDLMDALRQSVGAKPPPVSKAKAAPTKRRRAS